MPPKTQSQPPPESFSSPVTVPNINSSQFPTSVYGNPFGGANKPSFYKGKFQVFGGQNDLSKSIATRSLAIKGILDQFNRPSTPGGLQAALGASARQLGGGDAMTNEAFQSISPGIDSRFRMGEDVYKSNLIGMLTNAYTLGGSLYGAAYKASAIAKELSKQRDLAKTQQLQAIVGGVMSGLGMDKFGEKDTTVGAIGVGEM